MDELETNQQMHAWIERVFLLSHSDCQIKTKLEEGGSMQSHLVVILIGFLPVRGAQVGSLEVVVALRVLFPVLVEGCGVSRCGVLSEGEWVLASAHLAVTGLNRGLECLFWLESLLEVHPVLRRIAEFFLFTAEMARLSQHVVDKIIDRGRQREYMYGRKCKNSYLVVVGLISDSA